MAARLLIFMAAVAVRLSVFKTPAELGRGEMRFGQGKSAQNSLFFLRVSHFS